MLGRSAWGRDNHRIKKWRTVGSIRWRWWRYSVGVWETIIPITSTANWPITMSRKCHHRSKRRTHNTSARFTTCLGAKCTDQAFTDKAAARTSRYYRRRSIGRKLKSCRANQTCMARVTSERKISALTSGVTSFLKPPLKTKPSSRIECRRSRKPRIYSRSRGSPRLNRFQTTTQ